MLCFALLADLTAVIINPLHRDVPAMVCYIAPTCNKFTAGDCRVKYQRIKEMIREAGLNDIVGPLLGSSSDGDSRRRTTQIEREFMTCCSLNVPSFKFTSFYALQVVLSHGQPQIDTMQSMTHRLCILHTKLAQVMSLRILQIKISCSKFALGLFMTTM